jgi:hypothetical protein
MPSDQRGARGQLDAAMAEITQGTGAVLHVCPRLGRAGRQVILRDLSDDQGTCRVP